MTAPAVPQLRAPASAGAYLLAAVVVLFAEVGLYVFMTLNGHGSDFTGLGLLLTPIVLGLFFKAGVDAAAAPQNTALATIQHQTNGVLAQKIRDGVREVLTERDAAVAAATASAASAASAAVAAPSTAQAIAAAQQSYLSPPGTAAADFTPEPAPSYDEIGPDLTQVQPFTD